MIDYRYEIEIDFCFDLIWFDFSDHQSWHSSHSTTTTKPSKHQSFFLFVSKFQFTVVFLFFCFCFLLVFNRKKQNSKIQTFFILLISRQLSSIIQTFFNFLFFLFRFFFCFTWPFIFDCGYKFSKQKKKEFKKRIHSIDSTKKQKHSQWLMFFRFLFCFEQRMSKLKLRILPTTV